MAELESEFFIDYSSLDDYQRQLIDRKNNKPMVVTGAAGSGKSLIALHKAKQIAAIDSSYAIIVFTKTLQKYFADGLKTLGLKNVYLYNEWERMGTHVKYLIVDECQDFTSEQISFLMSGGDTCFFFGDTVQSIMDFENHKPQSVEDTSRHLGVTPMPLYFNYRLTKSIAKLAEEVGHVDDLEDSCKRDGERPNLLEASSFEGQLDKIAYTIKNRSLTNVGILLPFNTKDKGKMSVEFVKDYLLGKGITCEYKFSANQETTMDLNFHSNNPKIMTWWCAKGLQFKDVFIPGCENRFLDSKRSAFYVAMTRGSERLYLGYTGNLCPFFPSKNSSIYNNSSKLEMI